MQILSYKLNAYIPFDKDSIEKFLFVCEDVINNMTSDEKTIFKLKSATHELLINSLEHGYGKSAGEVCFSMSRKENMIQLEMSDEGTGFDASVLNLDEQNMNQDTLKGRGWGLLIIKKLCDSIQISPNTPRGTKVTVSINN
ncbi:MAG: ATP-binding protein [Clostridium sp.]|jgi:anti-sigma regulatory factor (Ser/Thr protein kinase)|nr:ATP-binding protein [Clostridium sp.]